MMKFNATQCVQRIKAGDVRAFSEIVAHYNKMVFTLVIKIIDNREDAEDITQEIFLKVFKSLEQFKEESEFSTWLYRIAYNTTLSEIRKRKLIFVPIEEYWASEEGDCDEIDALSKEDKFRLLDKALKRLPPDEALLITLFYLNDRTIDEISKITSLSVPNIKVKLHRIRKKLVATINQLMQDE